MKKITILSTVVLTSLFLVSAKQNKVQAAENQNIQSTQVEQSSVNNYINNNNLPYSGVKDETANSTFTQGGDYRNGKPEGIVIHETAKPNISAQQWADIYNSEWQKRQTYVHAFVDHNQVVQIAPTDKTVWGAGYYANQRFIQVELCEENNAHDFAQSIQNDATYVASLLHKYNLKPSLATADQAGTIWSHHDVSRYLGDTDHTDPDGYFAVNNYSMNQFFDLIKQRYDELSQVTSTNKPAKPAISDNVKNINDIAKITYNGRGKVAVWSDFGEGKKVIKYLPKNTNWRVFKIANYNGRNWYNLGGNQWIDGQYITLSQASKPAVKSDTVSSTGQVSAINKIVSINYNGRGKVAVWSNFDTTKHITGKYLAKNTNWRAFKLATDKNGHKWYNLGGNQWIDSSYIKEK
ncbi:N-acetylmuramoyl-L-alanine amidase family protein [uncultured Lactobacillus sp.]|uniref:peptidoglycan recognition protein family protein n=1 Tax=uncultured Lactobacillus sp. TaxID=153152 RepID=UPI002636764A|nr:peptidoglycan recognition family protein [uncultured Lactobacillus sp.]